MTTARRWYCPSCHAVLGTLTHYRDRRGRQRQQLIIARRLNTSWRWLRLCVECECGEVVPVPPSTDVRHRNA